MLITPDRNQRVGCPDEPPNCGRNGESDEYGCAQSRVSAKREKAGDRVLKRLKIRRFKSLHDVEIALPRMTVLFGPNAAGKSNLLDGIQAPTHGRSTYCVRRFDRRIRCNSARKGCQY